MYKGYNDLYMLIQGLRLKELLCKEKKGTKSTFTRPGMVADVDESTTSPVIS
jgi:hypothetical protein